MLELDELLVGFEVDDVVEGDVLEAFEVGGVEDNVEVVARLRILPFLTTFCTGLITATSLQRISISSTASWMGSREPNASMTWVEVLKARELARK